MDVTMCSEIGEHRSLGAERRVASFLREGIYLAPPFRQDQNAVSEHAPSQWFVETGGGRLIPLPIPCRLAKRGDGGSMQSFVGRVMPSIRG